MRKEREQVKQMNNNYGEKADISGKVWHFSPYLISQKAAKAFLSSSFLSSAHTRGEYLQIHV